MHDRPLDLWSNRHLISLFIYACLSVLHILVVQLNSYCHFCLVFSLDLCSKVCLFLCSPLAQHNKDIQWLSYWLHISVLLFISDTWLLILSNIKHVMVEHVALLKPLSKPMICISLFYFPGRWVQCHSTMIWTDLFEKSEDWMSLF